ncbi:hypothetical protein [Bifidobacterium vansinderenii]|uniref:Uncharacterized protein n=1 Tax=Bifidobacterium vansinderenii TaxID=1984871 RepID=A0A229VYB8_9BIFI|nr:hypothetical protein [Bifidobacterium vansinderenii]OXN00390.1 hypothetical protein Tam10B_1260 [Bifidobacterium vansinderenii]
MAIRNNGHGRWHINKDGDAKRCTATNGDCPYSRHYPDEASAMREVERQQWEIHKDDPLHTLKKRNRTRTTTR